MLLSYSKLFNNLQFDVSEKDIPLYQTSINAITNPSQRATLKQIRDRKINQEKNAQKQKYYDNPRAYQECQKCINALQQLIFGVDTPTDKRFLHNDDTQSKIGENIGISVVTVVQDKNGQTQWIPDK